MTKQDYLDELKSELRRHGAEDAEEIASEYEQHFLFKLADGFDEEQICAKLGAPAAVAAQFAGVRAEAKRAGGKKALLVLWLTLLGVFEAALDISFLCFVAALFCGAFASAALGAALAAGVNWMGLLPPMPYGAALVLGVMLLALGVILFIAALYCFAYLRQMVRASLRWRKNLLADAALPPLPVGPQFSPRARRGIRGMFLWAVMIFGSAFVLGYAILGLHTRVWEFWHALGWFGYAA